MQRTYSSGGFQAFLFLLCGGMAALVNIGVGYLLYESFGLKDGIVYQASLVVAYLAGMGVNFVLNRHVTFRNFSRGLVSQGRTFILVAAIGLVLTVLLSSLFRTTLDIWQSGPLDVFGVHLSHEAVSHIFAVGLVAIYSFIGHKFMTFQNGARAFFRRAVGRQESVDH